MRRRDHPQVGDVWATSDNGVFFTLLQKEPNDEYGGWDITILVNGNVETAYMDKDFSQLDGVYWKVA